MTIKILCNVFTLMSSFDKLLTLHKYGLFERNQYDKLVYEKSHIIIPFSKYSSVKYKRTVHNVNGYIFYIYSITSKKEEVNKYTLNNILGLLRNNKSLFVDFIQEMNIYFNEKQIIHNNYFSMNEINDILIRIYIIELTKSTDTISKLPPTVDILLDMVESTVTESKPTIQNNPFSNYIFCETPVEKQTIISPTITTNITIKNNITESTIHPVRETKQQPQINKPQYKKKSIPLVLKRKLWDKYFGEQNGIAQCPCCKMSQISTFSFHCGHIISEKCGGLLVLDNLIPLCQSCNSSMGMKSYTEFCKEIGIPTHII